MLLARIAQASADVTATSSRLKKVGVLADCLADATPDEVGIAVSYLSGELPQGTVGIGWAALRDRPAAAESPTLELLEVDAAVSELQAISGKGSQAARRDALAGLLSRATEPEQRLLVGLFLGELRQGALEGVMTDAVAKAADVPLADVRRAAMLAGDLRTVAAAAMRGGARGLEQFRLTPLRPITPMLAQTADDVASALGRLGRASIEWKLDGARIQAHRSGEEVRIFTRNLADITSRVPEIEAAIRSLDVDAVVLDGEAIALRADGRPEPFQVTMSRFGTRTSTNGTPLSVFLFDCLHLDGDDLVDAPAAERLAALAAALPDELLVPRVETDDPAVAEEFLDETLARGHEGVMVKSLDAPYEAGRRGAGWLKVKKAHTLDLVVLAAEWGHGRRQGKLSNLHLGARDPEGGAFVMLGKTFKGMTDGMLAWQTEHLLGLQTHTDGHVVHVRPELVVEIAFDGVQASTRYPGGVALRFARVKGYRPDKSPAEADTIDTVRAIHAHAQ
ncbi:MAG TPA: ATP-dependent DNA ligase [Gaiellaceae bacterium]|nr:ATP-dependent DNA ligase [Gaiellaceae bacterium]